MSILVSELYGKQIITTTGNKLGSVEDVILDVEQGTVSNLLMVKTDNLLRSKDTKSSFAKNNVKFERVKSISEVVVIGTSLG
jgi:sporulation protein YlmC with PRC-barrel domain